MLGFTGRTKKGGGFKTCGSTLHTLRQKAARNYLQYGILVLTVSLRLETE